MADSGSLRVRRHRLHARGDHSLCKRCDARRDALNLQIASQADAVVPVDARSALERLARRLEAAHEVAPDDAAVARELRMTLQALRGGQGDGDSELGALFADLSAT